MYNVKKMIRCTGEDVYIYEFLSTKQTMIIQIKLVNTHLIIVFKNDSKPFVIYKIY